MTEPQGDLPDVVGGLQHDDRAAVPELMWRHAPITQRCAGLGRLADMLVEHILEPCTGHRLTLRIDEELHVGQLEALEEQIATLDAEMLAWHRANEDSRRPATIPGIGLVTATALAATIDDAAQFDSGRAMAAWLGLTPRQNSSGNKERLGKITKAGNKYLRTLLVVGSTAIIRSARINSPDRLLDWVRGLLGKKPARLVTVALANKLARIAWAVLMRKRAFSNSIVTPAPAAI